MNKESAGILQVVRRRAATWLDQLTDQFRVMVDFHTTSARRHRRRRFADSLHSENRPGTSHSAGKKRQGNTVAQLQGEPAIRGAARRTSAGRQEHASTESQSSCRPDCRLWSESTLRVTPERTGGVT